MSLLSGWDALCFKGWVASWRVGPPYSSSTNFKGNMKTCAHNDFVILLLRWSKTSNVHNASLDPSSWIWQFVNIYFLLTFNHFIDNPSCCLISHIFGILLFKNNYLQFCLELRICLFFYKIMIFIVTFYCSNPKIRLEILHDNNKNKI